MKVQHIYNEAIIYLFSEALSPLEDFRLLITKFELISRFEKFSSLYQRKSGVLRESMYDHIGCVALIRTPYSLSEFLSQLSVFRESSKLNYLLLDFAGEVCLTPENLLPHPNLCEDNLILRASIELAPDKWHPVLEKTLRDIGAQFTPSEDVYFWNQGNFLFQEIK